jgi:type IV pilus assembly protein PilB
MHNHIEHIDTEVLQCLNAVQAWHYKIIPFKKEEEVLFCYAESERGKDELEILIGLQLVITTVNNEILTKLLSKYYRKNDKDIDKLSAKPEDLVSKIIIEAYEMESSDIHIEILEEKARVRYRIDGQLQEKIHIRKDNLS